MGNGAHPSTLLKAQGKFFVISMHPFLHIFDTKKLQIEPLKECTWDAPFPTTIIFTISKYTRNI